MRERLRRGHIGEPFKTTMANGGPDTLHVSYRTWPDRAPPGNEEQGPMLEVMTRANDLEVHEVPDGYIIYHTTRDNVSYLNKTAAIIFEFCDGSLAADEIVSRVSTAVDLGETSHTEIRACMASLVKEGLIQSISK
jgi:hypothetical protein